MAWSRESARPSPRWRCSRGSGHGRICASGSPPMVEVARPRPLHAAPLAEAIRLPVGPIGRHGLGSWGAGALIASEAALFGYLLFSYFYTAASSGPGWVLEPSPPLKLALPNTIVLLLSSVAAWIGER